jgi:type 1 glutamine amidotransferase
MRSTSLAFALLVPVALAQPPGKIAPPIEEQPADPKSAKVVLVAGSGYFKAGEHDYVAAAAVLADLLRQTPGVAPVVALDWPKKPETLAGAKAVVFFFDGAEKHAAIKADRAAQVAKLADGGCGIVQFHQAVDYPKDFAERARGWAGAAWEKGTGERAHWVEEFKTFPDHPICRGVTPFKIDDGWLWKLTFADGPGVTPLLRTWNPKAKDRPKDRQDVVAWAYESGAKRGFSFTGGHLHASFAEEGYRRFLTNGILWAAGVDVPKGGAKVDLDPKALPQYLSPAPKKK